MECIVVILYEEYGTVCQSEGSRMELEWNEYIEYCESSCMFVFVFAILTFGTFFYSSMLFQVVQGGFAETAGLRVGDVLMGVTGIFGEMESVTGLGVDKV
jgi:hypothetical protein